MTKAQGGEEWEEEASQFLTGKNLTQIVYNRKNIFFLLDDVVDM